MDKFNDKNVLAAAFEHGTNPGEAEEGIAFYEKNIDAGTAEFTLGYWQNPQEIWTGAAGQVVDVYIVVDMDDSGDPTEGDYAIKALKEPLSIQINGDIDIFYTADDFSEITGI
ncbi:MAG: hypothetical protein R6W70_02370 [bacterium]